MRARVAIASLLCWAGCQLISGIDEYETGEGKGGGPTTAGNGGSGGNEDGGSGGLSAGGSGGEQLGLTGLWIRPEAAQGSSEVLDMATVPNDGSPIIAGHLTSEITVLGDTIAGPGGFVARLDQAGGLVWATEISATEPDQLAIRAVAASPVVTAVVGHFQGEIAFPTDADAFTLNAPAGATFVAAYQTDSGVFLWARRAIGGSAEFHDVAVRPATNEVAAVGVVDGVVIVRASSDSTALCTGGDAVNSTPDALVVRFAANGTCDDQTVTVLTGCANMNGADGATSALYSGDSFYLAGYFSGRLGVGPSECLGAADEADAFVARYTAADGAPLAFANQQTTLRGAGNQYVDDLITGEGDVLGITGTFTQTLDGESAEGARDVFFRVTDAGLADVATLRVGSDGDTLTPGGAHFTPDGLAVAFSCLGPVTIGAQQLAGASEDVCFAQLDLDLRTGDVSPRFTARWGDDASQVPLACGGYGDRFFVAGQNFGSLVLPGAVTQDIPGTNVDGFVLAVEPAAP